MTHAQAIDQIPNDAAANEAEGDLTGSCTHIKMVPAEIKNAERYDRYCRQQKVVIRKQAPGRARVPPVHEFEESGNNDLLARRIIQESMHNLFRQLIQNQHPGRNDCNAAVRRF